MITAMEKGDWAEITRINFGGKLLLPICKEEFAKKLILGMVLTWNEDLNLLPFLSLLCKAHWREKR